MKKAPWIFSGVLPHFAAFLQINCFLIKKELLYSNVKDSILILPWINPISDHNDFSKYPLENKWYS